MAPRIALLAKDLIWSDRLANAAAAAGAQPVRVRTPADFDGALVDARLAIVDLTATAYDGLAAIERARSSGARVLAIGQHDDVDLRKRALASGAERVLAYRKLFEDGPATIASWVARSPVKEPAR